MRRAVIAPLLLGLLLAGPAAADTFRVLLGGRDLGTVAVEREGEALSLDASFADTPLGVADGTFRASSRPVRAPDGAIVRQYLAESAFSDGGRTVSVLHDGGHVLGVDVAPADERTELSDPAAVPAPVLDAVEGLAAIVEAGGCPAPFRLYEGRRLIEVAVAPEPAADGTACAGTYRVVAGPGHLSPLGIRTVRLGVAYDAGGALARLDLRSGPFELSLVR